MDIFELETPSVLIDLDRLQANITRMQAHCSALGVAFRPHIKTHKIPAIAQMQIDAGAVGIACQKVSEAEVFASAGFNDIQIPYNILGEAKTSRLANLALYNRVTVSADNPKVISGLEDAAHANEMTIRVLIELATEIGRTGAQVEDVVQLATQIESAENLHFAGLLVYPSNPSIRPALQEAIALLSHAGIGVDTVSGGGTGASHFAPEVPELTELRVGTYVFNDWTTVQNGWAALEDCAMRIRATVAILDCGSKTLSSDIFSGVYGYMLQYPDARIYRLNEEHAYVDLAACEERPDIGEIVDVIPVHACVVTNLHDTLYGVRGTDVEVAWAVQARGKVW